MTVSPTDLVAVRADVLARTGLAGDAVGIVGNQAHVAAGVSYHLGKDQLKMSKHPYSARLARDIRGLTNSASAMDIGDDWPRGGRAAWLRFNNLLAAALRGNDPALAAIRAINYSPDGATQRRIDRQDGFAAETTDDTVTIHTHIEWYRDTEGQRAGACKTRLGQLIQQAITGKTPATQQEDDMKPMVLVQLRTGGQVWLSDMMHRRPIADLTQLSGVASWISANHLGLGDSDVMKVDDLDVFGVAVPAPLDQAALVGAIIAALPVGGTGNLTSEQVKTAAEQAIAEVLTGGTAAVSQT